MSQITGVLDDPRGGRVRVVCVRGTEITAEALVDGPGGAFSVEPSEPPDWVVVQTVASRLAAVALRPAPVLRIGLADTARVTLQAEQPPAGAGLWLDPLRLEGFPDELLWVLRARPDGSVALHVLDATLSDGSAHLDLQVGTYRLSGGLQPVRPWDAAATLSRVVDRATGRTLPVSRGESTFAVTGGAVLEVTFDG